MDSYRVGVATTKGKGEGKGRSCQPPTFPCSASQGNSLRSILLPRRERELDTTPIENGLYAYCPFHSRRQEREKERRGNLATFSLPPPAYAERVRASHKNTGGRRLSPYILSLCLCGGRKRNLCASIPFLCSWHAWHEKVNPSADAGQSHVHRNRCTGEKENIVESFLEGMDRREKSA